MPLIIDANRAGDFSAPASNHAPEVLRRVARGVLKIVIGGQLTRELTRAGMGQLLLEWGRGGHLQNVRSRLIDDVDFDVSGCVSNDAHVVRLALASGTRLLYTDDQLLTADFKNGQLVAPRGKIIRSATRPRVARALLERHRD